MKNKNILKIIDILFWFIIIAKITFDVLKQISDTGTNIPLDNIIFVLLLIGFCVIKSMLSLYWFIGIYIGFKIAYKKYYKEKLDKIDLKNDTYYREIISQNSPGVLSYIDDFKLDEKDIVATFMSLEIKKRIKIEDKIILLNPTTKDLEENERYILDNIKNNTINSIDITTFKNKVIDDCLKKSLLVEKRQKKNILNYFIIYILIIGGFTALVNLFSNIQTKNGLVLILFMLGLFIVGVVIAIYPFVLIIYMKSYNTMKNLNPYVRSKEAKDINLKLEGLKNYIKEYSLLKDKEYKDLIIWENYLVYSIILGNNTKIVKEVIQKITGF